MATHEELIGVYRSTRWSSADPSSPYIIGQLDDTTTVKGPAEAGELQPNTLYKFFGKWQDGNARFGKSFAFICAVKEIPHTRKAIIEYLIRALRNHNTGIGEKTANRLYDLYQADAVRKLRMHPADVAADLPHPIDQCRRAAEILETDRKFEDAKIALVDLFAGTGFPRDAIRACIDRWGAAAPAQIRRDAFLMMTNRIAGAGFLRCDKLYLSLGGDAGKLKRQVLCAHHEIRTNGSGDTWRPVQFAVDTIRSKIAGSDPQPERALKVGGRTRRFSFHWAGPESNGDSRKTFIADSQHARSEADIARLVLSTLHDRDISPWPAIPQGDLTDHQFAALQAATAGRIGILNGGPGTGKTFAAAAVIRAVVERHGEAAIAVCAPTGKAAVRIGESMDRYEIQGIKPATIHRTLVPNDLGYGTGNWNFQHNESCPLDAEFVVVDESSMIDADLMAALLRATVRSRVLFLGDVHQLPPVGHGAPLRDLIDAGLCRGELTELHRNSGDIVKACQAIREARPFATSDKFDDSPGGPGHNLRLMPATESAAVKARLAELFAELKAENPGLDLIEDCQVLVGLNEKSELSRKVLNPLLQHLLNPDGESAEISNSGKSTMNPYRVGDKVICLTNDKYADAANPKLKHRIYNGEQGRVVAVAEQHVTFEFADTGDGIRQTKQSVRGESANSFGLAYAITVHKSQGSEWPIVVVVTDDAAWRIASREWHYTAISRARHRCVILGSIATIRKQCRRVIGRDRKTFLVERIRASQANKEGKSR